MTDILATARAHAQKMKGQKIEIPEWGAPGEPAVIYYDPLSMRERQSLQQQATKGKGESAVVDNCLLVALTVAKHSKNEQGEPIFPPGLDTITQLENDVDPNILARIAEAMVEVTDEVALGNSSEGTKKPGSSTT